MESYDIYIFINNFQVDIFKEIDIFFAYLQGFSFLYPLLFIFFCKHNVNFFFYFFLGFVFLSWSCEEGFIISYEIVNFFWNFFIIVFMVFDYNIVSPPIP